MQPTPAVHTGVTVAKSPKRGFALLITITLLAFLVLLLVSLASLTRVETQVAGNNQQLSQARQNALMALNIALGQLQKYAGSDQRVTAPASFALTAPAAQLSDAQKGLVTPVAGAQHWVGVWGNSSVPTDIYAATPKPVLLNWLISGNEQAAAPTAADDGQITSPTVAATPTYRPNQTVANLTLASTANDTTITVNSQPARLLVGPRSAGTNAGALNRYIAAPLVDLKSTNVPGLGSASTTIGRYAYWIGDEGTKAQYNLRDTLTATDATTSADARYRLRTPARNAIELLTGYGSYPVNGALLDNIKDKNQLRLADTGLSEQDQQTNFHDLTTNSWGVLANSQSGGLRSDLTHALQQSSLGANFANKTIIPDVTLGSGTTQTAPVMGAKWETLKSFSDLTTAAWQSTPVEVRSATATVAGISPVVVQNRLMFGLESTPAFTSTVPAARRFFVDVYAAFTISNPYTFPIRASQGVDFSYAITTATGSEWGINMVQRYYSGTTKMEAPFAPFTRNKFGALDTYGGTVGYLPILTNKINFDDTRSILGNVRFQTPGFTLQPGEVKTYTLASVTTSPANSSSADLTLTEGSNLGYYKFDTGADAPAHPNATSAGLGYFVRMLPYGAMTLQMATHGSPAADGTLTQPQAGVLQSVVNIDLTANNATNATSNTPSAPKPQSFSVYAASAPVPLQFGGYGMSLALPTPDTNFYNDTTGTMGSHRVYADYNLTALNFALPPVAAFLSAASATTQLETVPPYTRKYIRGPNFSYDANAAALSSTKFQEGLLTPRWGTTTAPSGKQTTILYDAPRRSTTDEAALFSIGQLQHADLTGDDNYRSVSYQPHNAVGNSFYSPYVLRTSTVQSRPRLSPQPNGVAASGNVRMFDLPYLLNAALWDNYFFSSLIQTGADIGKPANQRLAFAASYNPTSAQLGIGLGDQLVTDLSGNGTQLLPEKTAARYLMTKGAFNINSTSVDAWRAVLAGTRSLHLSTDTTGTPLARSLSQSLSAVDAENGDEDTTFSGYRRLTDAQVTTLATKIVEQVRLRGPFVSLAHFVNRQVGAINDATSSKGALQAAIDAAAVNPFASATDVASVAPTAVYAANGETDLGNRSTAVPGWLTQADVLQSIGSALSARSDTFTVRVYADVTNPLDTTIVTSRVWCEAVVQRFPDYVDKTISAAAAPTSTTNKRFGRQFRVISFRWLTASDI
jgi:hypothetical protein